MKKFLLTLLSLTFAVAASAQFLGKYKTCGFERAVNFDDMGQVIFEPSENSRGQLILLEKGEEIKSFRKSLADLKEEYIAKKESIKDFGKVKMSTSFDEITMGWRSPSNQLVMGFSRGIRTIFDRSSKNKKVSANIISTVKEETGRYETDLFIRFENEDEIQSLIDLLDVCLERLGIPSSTKNTSSSSQITKENLLPEEPVNLFDYTFYEISGRKGLIKGLICPTKIEQYNIMFIYAFEKNWDNYYFIIPNEKICNDWVSALTSMKELFIKNDKIAKDNNVIADIVKDVSDKFTFGGFWGRISRGGYIYIVDPIKEVNEGYQNRKYFILVEYKYINGQSSMVLSMEYVDRQYGHHSEGKVWTFNSVNDFDTMINVITWSNFMNSFNAQAQEIKNKQELEAKKKQQQSLFD